MPLPDCTVDRIATNRLGTCPPKIRSCPLNSHGEALLAAKRPELQPLIDHLREVAKGRGDIRTECAGVLAGWGSAIPPGEAKS